MKEENVKIKIVLPLLRALGFTDDDLEFEHHIPKAASVHGRRGFVDILARRGGIPVLLVEVKSFARSLEGTLDERESVRQAVDYARATDHQPLYTLVTNGKKALLIDVISRQDVVTAPLTTDPSDKGVQAMAALLARAVDDLREKQRAALVSLGALDEDLIKELAASQRAREMALLAGTVEEDGRIAERKYIPALYVQRHKVHRQLHAFLDSDSLVFALVGDAGMGKSNFMCDAATELSTKHPVFFYNGAELPGTLVGSLAEDLQSPIVDASALLKIVSEAMQGGMVLVFIDGLNEAVSDRRRLRAELNRMSRTLQGTCFKMVISCRSRHWEWWCRSDAGMTNHFGRMIYINQKQVPREQRGVVVGEFDDEEFARAWRAYEHAFNLKGDLSERMQTLCREPFLLRLVAEVYKQNRPIPEFIEPLDLFRRYFEEKFHTEERHLGAKRLLFRLAARMLERGEPRVAVEHIRGHDLAALSDLLDERIIIYRHRRHIQFHFELFLEFIIAEYLLEGLPDEPSDADRQECVRSVTESGLPNGPGVVENLLLSWQGNDVLVETCARFLVEIDDQWKAIVCSLMRKLQAPSRRMTEVVKLLSRDPSHLVRLFLSQSLTRFIANTGPDCILDIAQARDHWESRETAANIIGYERLVEGAAMDALMALAADYHWRVRRAAGYSLQTLLALECKESARLRQRVLGVSGSGPWRVKYSACIALLGTDLDSTSREAELVRSFAMESNPQVRWAFVNYLPRFAGAERDSFIESMQTDPNPWVRKKLVDSCCTLAEMGNSAAYRSLEKLAGDEDESVRVALARQVDPVASEDMLVSLIEPYVQESGDPAIAAAYTLHNRGLLEAAKMHEVMERSTRPDLAILRERIARRDFDPASGRLHRVHEYISRRSEIATRYDPYMEVIDTLSSLIAQALATVDSSATAHRELLLLLASDTEEAVRWALVAHLAMFRSPTDEDSLELLSRLANDAHWWVRREVAIALGNVTADESVRATAIERLDQIRRHEIEIDEPCSDEVLHFVDESVRKCRVA